MVGTDLRIRPILAAIAARPIGRICLFMVTPFHVGPMASSLVGTDLRIRPILAALAARLIGRICLPMVTPFHVGPMTAIPPSLFELWRTGRRTCGTDA
jgi:hypothetical protein